MNSDPSPKNNVIQIVTLAMTASYAALYAAGWFLVEQSGVSSQSQAVPENVIQILTTIAWVHIFLSVPLRSFLFKIFSAKKEDKHGPFFMAHLISLAVRESGVIIGFVATKQTGSLDILTYTALAGVLINIATWPRSVPE